MSIPGPLALGRGVVVSPGGDVPEPFRDAPRVRVDDGVLADPEASPALDALGAAWAQRAPVVVELAAGAADLKAPEVCGLEPWRLGAEFTFSRERLHFLVWANTYD
ncbi:MAG: hypothetical protein ACRDY7_04225, partial [Acidimicrobiia bacterium]